MVAVSRWVNEIEIEEIATDPDERNVFPVESFDMIGTITEALQRTICDGEGGRGRGRGRGGSGGGGCERGRGRAGAGAGAGVWA